MTQVRRPTDYPAIARAKRIVTQRLGITGSDNIFGGQAAPSAEQRSQRHLRAFKAQDSDCGEVAQDSSATTLGASNSVSSEIECRSGSRSQSMIQDQSCTKLKGGCSLEESGRRTGSSEDDDLGITAGRCESASSSPPLSPPPHQEKTAISREQIFREMQQVSRNVQVEALALEKFVSDEITPAANTIFDEAVIQHKRAMRLLAVDLPSPATWSTPTVAETTRPPRVEKQNEPQGASSGTQTSQSSRGQQGVSRDEHQGVTARTAPIAPIAPPVPSVPSVLPAPALPLPEAEPEATRPSKITDADEVEKPKRDPPAVIGFASVEVGVSVRNSIKLADEANGEAGDDFGNNGDDDDDDDDDMDEGGGHRVPSRPMSTDISSKIMGLSSIIRRKAAEASANRRWQQRQQLLSRVVKSRDAPSNS